MTNPSLSRARRIAGAVLVVATLGAGTSTVVPSAPVAAAPAAPNVVGLRKGARGDAVKALQEALVRVGVGVKYGVDSYFGSATEASVKAFQRIKGISITGVVDAATATALGLATAPAPAAPSAPAAAPATDLLARGSTGPLVAQVQQALINFGFPIASGADGIFGASTERALKAFQKANGLGVSGRTYPSTMRVLGVVALAAAAAAPRPLPRPRRRQPRRPPACSLAARRAPWSPRSSRHSSRWADRRRCRRHVRRRPPSALDGIPDEPTGSASAAGRTSTTPRRACSASRSRPALHRLPRRPATGIDATGFAAYDERGARVVALQQALINAGIPVRGGADGVFGSGTASAVMAFQRAKGLKASGKVDAATAAALGLASAAAPAPTPAVSTSSSRPSRCRARATTATRWNAARGNGRVHLGVDILAAEGNALYAVVTGKVIQIYTDAPGSLSGNGIKIARPDGTYFFYAHLSALAPGWPSACRCRPARSSASSGAPATPPRHTCTWRCTRSAAQRSTPTPSSRPSGLASTEVIRRGPPAAAGPSTCSCSGSGRRKAARLTSRASSVRRARGSLAALTNPSGRAGRCRRQGRRRRSNHPGISQATGPDG